MPALEERLSKAISDRYQIGEMIGAGAMGSVFLAEDRKLRRSVAIKVMRPELSASVTADRFLREIRVAAGLAHPHIVPVHDSGEAEGILYFVMRFQEGESLRALLDREGQLPIDQAISIARDISEGLTHAHAQGVIHRDIKPANILLTGAHALIADFGVARAVAQATLADAPPTSSVLGTPLYMSPEQAAGSQEIDGRSDVYSLGCVLFEMVTGIPPFRAPSAASVLASHFHKAVPSVRGLRPDVPLGLVEVVRQTLAKSPERRFQSAASLQQALESAQSGLGRRGIGLRDRWLWLSRRTRRLSATAVGVSLVVLAAGLARFLLAPETSAPDPSSMVVLPFRGPTTMPGVEGLLVEMADELTRQLNQWDSVSAVSQIALSGIRFDMGLGTPILERVEDGLALAEAVSAGTMVALSALIQGDSVLVSANLFDAQTGRTRGRTREALGQEGDLSPAVAEVANLILGLEGSAAEIAQLREQSAVPEALIEYDAGRRALEAWRLMDAEGRFRTATSLDPGFAMAHHLLSLSLYWQWEEGLTTAEVVGEEIPIGSTMARRNSVGLPLKDSLHIVAFNRFQAGDYEEARINYRALLERDSADVFAWFLQGSVEYHDPWLAELPTGKLSPRSNLNLARRSLEKVVRLSPGFHGAYGTVLDIATAVVRAAEGAAAPGFEIPRGEFFPPWAQPETPHQAEVYWPAYLDSLGWFTSEEWTLVPDSVASRRANILLEESLGVLRRWAAYEPDQARPQLELARWALSLRSRLRGVQPPARIDSLTSEAFRYSSRALALAVDTTQQDFLRLANLHLAMGEVQDAQSAWESAFNRDEPSAPFGGSSAASNVLLFSGRPERALALLETEPSRSHYYLDSVSGGLVDDGGADALIQGIRILSATGQAGPTIEAALLDLLSHWSSAPGRTEREMVFLRARIAPQVALALRHSPEVAESWLAGLELRDPLWGLLRSEPVEDPSDLISAALHPETPEVGGLSRTYILGKLAQDVGDHSLAVRIFSRLDSLAFRIQVRDSGWGLLALSYFDRGVSYEAMGDLDHALDFFTRFSEAWPEPDGSEELAREARRRLDELSQETRTGGD